MPLRNSAIEAAPVRHVRRRLFGTWRAVLAGFSRIFSAVSFLTALFTSGADLNGQNFFEVDGFTEPLRRIMVGCAEHGILEAVEVRVGDRVQRGQVLARLESAEHEALLELSEHQMRAEGRLLAAQAEYRLRRSRLDALTRLIDGGYATREELRRAQMEYEVVQANVQAAQEDLIARRLEHQRIRAQLENRSIRAPENAVVLELLKHPGEFVAPSDPNVLVIAVLDRLLATFSVPQSLALDLAVGQPVVVYLASKAMPVEGTIELVSPVTDAESGQVHVQVLLDNSAGLYRSGDRCRLLLSQQETSDVAGADGDAITRPPSMQRTGRPAARQSPAATAAPSSRIRE